MKRALRPISIVSGIGYVPLTMGQFAMVDEIDIPLVEKIHPGKNLVYPWKAQIKPPGEPNIVIGFYKTPREAFMAYATCAYALFGEYARVC